MELEEDKIFYFDSMGESYTKHDWIHEYLNKLKEEHKNTWKRDINIISCNVKHQKGSLQCGIYCIKFINMMLEQKLKNPSMNLEKFFNVNFNSHNKKLSDYKMHLFREELIKNGTLKMIHDNWAEYMPDDMSLPGNYKKPNWKFKFTKRPKSQTPLNK